MLKVYVALSKRGRVFNDFDRCTLITLNTTQERTGPRPRDIVVVVPSMKAIPQVQGPTSPVHPVSSRFSQAVLFGDRSETPNPSGKSQIARHFNVIRVRHTPDAVEGLSYSICPPATECVAASRSVVRLGGTAGASKYRMEDLSQSPLPNSISRWTNLDKASRYESEIHDNIVPLTCEEIEGIAESLPAQDHFRAPRNGNKLHKRGSIFYVFAFSPLRAFECVVGAGSNPRSLPSTRRRYRTGAATLHERARKHKEGRRVTWSKRRLGFNTPVSCGATHREWIDDVPAEPWPVNTPRSRMQMADLPWGSGFFFFLGHGAATSSRSSYLLHWRCSQVFAARSTTPLCLTSAKTEATFLFTSLSKGMPPTDADIEKLQKESDRNAKHARKVFQKMGNRFYKDPDLERPAEATSYSHSIENKETEVETSVEVVPAMPAKVRNDAVSQSTSELEVELIRNLIKRHKHITILLVDDEVTDSFRRAVGKEPRLKIKPVDTHAAEGFLVIYAEDTGHFAELSSVIDVSVRDVARRFTLSPDTILRPANTLRGIENVGVPQKDSDAEVQFDRNKLAVGDTGVPDSQGQGRVRIAGVVIPIATLACAAGAAVAWLTLAYDLVEWTLTIIFYAVRALDFVRRATAFVIRLTCLTAWAVLSLVVDPLLDLRDQFAEVAARQ
ncbi:hypothetical protein FA13DRAFT_1716663 [Coprinellus micaceus]|uniref:Uncharacterized protein n=1 Tax=Coprinellus micaceus TaxID=71717 RepID=A0A4Y7SJ68_COPMI|nr:hypothetical protein FA13DRAFT_1716663 [Coprinellus micaceus]